MKANIKDLEENIAVKVYMNLKSEILKETENIKGKYKNKSEMGFSRGSILLNVYKKLQNRLDIDSNLF